MRRFARARDSRVVFTPERVEGTAERLPVAWDGFANLVDKGDVLYLADGAVRLRVDEVNGGDVVTRVEVGGSVASRQGMNLPNVTVSLPAVSEEDIGLIDVGLELGVDFFALSFVRRREDLDPVREHLAARDIEVPLMAWKSSPGEPRNGFSPLPARITTPGAVTSGLMMSAATGFGPRDEKAAISGAG